MLKNNQLNVQKKQKIHYSGKKKCHTQKAQLVINKETQMIVCTNFSNGKKHDFKLFKDSKTICSSNVLILGDSGYQGLANLHSNSQIPIKKTKGKFLNKQQKIYNHNLSSERILVENIIRKIKIFRILKERYRNRRKRFSLRFNLIAAIYNKELIFAS